MWYEKGGARTKARARAGLRVGYRAGPVLRKMDQRLFSLTCPMSPAQRSTISFWKKKNSRFQLGLEPKASSFLD